MPSPATLDLDALTAPIPGEVPTGADLRADESANSVYYDLRTMRQECREAERAADYPDPNLPSPPRPKWEELQVACDKALREKSKDLEVACWLVEAQARIRQDPPVSQFAGLRDGFKLVNALCSRYWDGLYSIQDESDPKAKGEPITVLNGKDGRDGALVLAIRKIPLTLHEDPGPFSLWHCEVQQKKNEMGAIEALARKGARAFYEPLLRDIAETRAAFAELETNVRNLMTDNAPSCGLIRDTLEQADRMVQLISGIRLQDQAAPAAGAAPAADGKAAAGTRGAIPTTGEFATRDQALEALLAIARFFREREPNAPISYTIEDAVRRARMPLNDLLAELLDDEARRRMLLNAGILPPEPKAG